MKRWIGRLLCVIVSLLMVGAVMETIVRLTWQGVWIIPRECLQDPGKYSRRFKPNFSGNIPVSDGGSFPLKTNSRGYQGVELGDIKEGQLRVACIGDSFTVPWGIPLETHFIPRALQFEESRTTKADEIGVAMIACGAWGPKDYWLAYIEEVRPFGADLVVLGLFPGNDILAIEKTPYQDPGDVPSRRLREERSKSFWRWETGKWIYYKATSIPAVISLSMKFGHVPDSFSRFVDDADYQQRLWATSFHYLDLLRTAAMEDGLKLVVVTYPSYVQVAAPDQIRASGLDPFMPQKVIDGWCKEHHVEHLDLLSAIQDSEDPPGCFFPQDKHLTEKGHAVCESKLGSKLVSIIHSNARRAK